MQAELPSWVRLVREVTPELAATFKARPAIHSPADAAAYLTPRMAAEEVEVFVVMALDAQSRVIALQEVTRGLVDSTMVHPREVFRAAIVLNASAVIIAHNHPSGELSPSQEDREMTEQLSTAGRHIDIPVHDHLIIGVSDYLSFAERGYL